MEYIHYLSQFDRQVTLFLNSFHNSFFDFLMDWISYRFTWVPFYLFLLYILFKHFGKSTWLMLIGIALLITASDQSANLIKNHLVQRYRPCHDASLSELIHLVGNCGGNFGFISAHASNSFALAIFLILSTKKRISWLNPVMLVYAALVSYSRVYNGVHFVGDILCGALWGFVLAYGFSKIYLHFEGKIDKID